MRRRRNMIEMILYFFVVAISIIPDFTVSQTYDAVPIGTPFLRPPPSPRAEPERPNPQQNPHIPRGYQPPPRPSHFDPPRSYNRFSQQQNHQIPPTFQQNRNTFPSFRAPSVNIDDRPRIQQTPSNWQMQQLQQQHPQRFQQRLPVPFQRQEVGAPGQVPRFQSSSPPILRIPTSSVHSRRPAQVQVSPSGLDNGQIDPINNIIIHLYLNAKDKMSHAEIKTPVRGLFGIGTSHGGPGSHADPIIITKDFDRETLEFVDDSQKIGPSMNPSNIIEVKATVSTPNRQLENAVNKAVNQELDRAIPKVIDRMRGSMTMDNAMRKELEEALVDELAKNLGDTIDKTDITEEDLGKLIEEGFDEVTRTEPSTTTPTSAPPAPPTTRTTTERPTTTEQPTTTTVRQTTTTPTTTSTTTTTTTTERPTTATTTQRWTRPTTTTPRWTTRTTEVPATPPTTTSFWFNAVTEQSNDGDDDDYSTEEQDEDISQTSTSTLPTTTTTRRVIIITTTPTTTTSTTTRRVWTSPTTTIRTTTSSPPTTTTEETTSTTYGHIHFVPGFRVTETTSRVTFPTTYTTEATSPTTQAPTSDYPESSEELETTYKYSHNSPEVTPLSDKLVTRKPMIEVSPSVIQHHGVVSLASGEEEESSVEPTRATVTSRPINVYTTTEKPTNIHNLPTKPPSSGPVAWSPSTFSPPLVTSETLGTPTDAPPTVSGSGITFTETDLIKETLATIGSFVPNRETTRFTAPVTTTTESTTESTTQFTSTIAPVITTEAATTQSTTHPTTPPTTTFAPVTTTQDTTTELPFATDDFTIPPSTASIPIQVEPHTKHTEEPNSIESGHTTTSGTDYSEEDGGEEPFSTNIPNFTPTTPVKSGHDELPKHNVTTTLTHLERPSPVIFGSSEESDYEYTSEYTKSLPSSTNPPTTTQYHQKPTTRKPQTSSEEIQPNVVLQNGQCPTPNLVSDRNQSDVLFLLDSSDSFNEEKFHRAIALIGDTVKHFNNFGPEGTQISLVQYNDEPYLEFSLRKHNCKKHLLDDIADTEYMTGGSQLGKALSKVSQFAFTKKRGDRPDAENVLIIVTDGQSEDRVQQPMKLAKDNNVTVLVISSIEADKEYVNELAGHRDSNMFGLDDDDTNQKLSWKLARRISEVSKPSSVIPSLTPLHPTIPSNRESNTNNLDADLDSAEVKLPTKKLTTDEHGNEFVHLECVAEGFKIKVIPPTGFHGIAVVKGYQDDAKCKSTATSSGGEVNLFIANNECGVTQVKSLDPKGLNSSLVLHLLHDKELNTGEDRAYLLQCFVGTPHDTELSTNLDVVRSELTIAETISLSTLPPTCTYSIRKDSPDGPIAAKAVVGQTVYHRWDCDGSNETTNAYGIQIHSCYASDDVERKFAFVDPRGCSSDLALLSDLTYNDDSLTAYAASHVFSVHDAESLKFVCKLSLCTRDGDGCEGLTPPACGNNNGNKSDLLLTKRLVRNQNSAVDDALTSALSTQVGLSPSSGDGISGVLSSIASNNFFLIVAIAAIAAIVLISVISRNHSDADTATTCSDPTSSSMSDPQEFGSVRSISSENAQPNPRLAEFMRSFDRSRYV